MQKILLVEDSKTVLTAKAMQLEKIDDIEVITALNGYEAIEKVSSEKPDIILLDILMPGISGYETCKKIKSNPNTSDIPIIFHSSNTDTEDVLKGFEVGGIDFLSKNIRSEIFIARIKNHLKLVSINKGLNSTLDKLKNAQGKLIHSEKLAGIGQLAAGVAHEINNPVGFVSSNTETLKDYVTKLSTYYDKCMNIPELEKFMSVDPDKNIPFMLDDIKDIVDENLEGLKRIKVIVNNLRSFARIDESEQFTLANINDGISNTLTVANNEIKYHADIETDFGDLPELECSLGELNQVFLNIIVNAAQAIRDQDNRTERGLIKIKTETDDENIYCEFSDNGPGIPKEIINKIFDPFFTTKEAGKGTGLGLNIAYDIITNRHGGSITVNSIPDNGTTFSIILPINKE